MLLIIKEFAGGPAGIEAIAAAISEDKDTIEDLYEPFLIQQGFIQRTSRGRIATEQAYNHFGISKSDTSGTVLQLPLS